MLDRSFKIRIHRRYERPLHQFAKKPPKPYSANSNRPDDIEPAHNKRTRLKAARHAIARPDHVKHIYDPHKKDKYGKGRQPPEPSLEVLLQQDEKRKGKVKKDQRCADPAPAAFHPDDPTACLLRNI